MRVLAAAVLGLFASSGCESRVPEPESQPLAKPAGQSVAQHSHEDEMDRAAEALLAQTDAQAKAAAGNVTELTKKDARRGSGREAKPGDLVRVHYTGRLRNGVKFDSSYDRGKPFEFTLGQGQVIRGWDEGVVGMKRGGKRKLVIPSEMAYGRSGSPPKIPPDSALEFDIELLEVVARDGGG